jgi:WD40 repeat protein
LCLSPSGNFLWAGFSDGTLRVFDLSGRFSLETEDSWHTASSRQKSAMMLPSKFHQRFGAVACQIHARGVHTDLLMQVDMCGDYVFGGVPRGAMELYAVSTRELEAQVRNDPETTPMPTTMTTSNSSQKNILDSIHVHVHADAKLKGFGACAQLQNDVNGRPTYLLLTGKGIKNIHIWKFQPPLNERDEHDHAIWEQLYDTQTNGNTIHLLSFYRTPLGNLMGVSQSDTQKLRLWDLSQEEEEPQDKDTKKPRPKRPAYQDVANSQGSLGIAGGYGVCGGPTMYNQLSIVSLDQPKSAYNHTELALPGAAQAATSSLSTMGGRGRQRRGDLKQLVNVATLPNDSNHALLELDDVRIRNGNQ